MRGEGRQAMQRRSAAPAPARLTSGFSPIFPPRKIFTPSTALPSSLAGAPISPMSPTCACSRQTGRRAGQTGERAKRGRHGELWSSGGVGLAANAKTRLRRAAAGAATTTQPARRPPRRRPKEHQRPKQHQRQRQHPPGRRSWGSPSSACGPWRESPAAPPAGAPPAGRGSSSLPGPGGRTGSPCTTPGRAAGCLQRRGRGAGGPGAGRRRRRRVSGWEGGGVSWPACGHSMPPLTPHSHTTSLRSAAPTSVDGQPLEDGFRLQGSQV